MSAQGFLDFRNKINANADLQTNLYSELAKGPHAIVRLGAVHGYAFTADEVSAAIAGSDLTDFELELVAGGAGPAMGSVSGPADVTAHLSGQTITKEGQQYRQGGLPR